jgi:hypothetical protein
LRTGRRGSNGRLGKTTNVDIIKLYSSDPEGSCGGHVARMGDMRISDNILVGNLK